MVHWLFEIDRAKHRPTGLKMPVINFLDRSALVPSLERCANFVSSIEGSFETSLTNCLVPNIITGCSLIVRAFGIVCLWLDSEPRFLSSSRRAKRVLAALSFLTGYFLDCLDGYYARKYNKCTLFGCWFDHLNDILSSVIFFGLVLYKRMYICAALMVVMFVFVINQILFEEEAFGDCTDFFRLVVDCAAHFRLFHDPEFMRWFGTTSWFALIALVMAIE